MSFSEILRELYYGLESPAAYASSQTLAREAKKINPRITVKKVQNWLSTQDVHTIHRSKRKTYPRRRIITKGLDDVHQMDLLDVSRLAYYNSNVKYLLVVVDCFSRFAFVIPLKRKLGLHVSDAIDNLYKQNSDRIPNYIWTDEGGEFMNVDVRTTLRKYRIKWYSIISSKKASIVERLNRSLRLLLSKALFGKSRPRYLELLPKLVDIYNNRKHRTIGMAPAEVRKSNEQALWIKQYSAHLPTSATFKFTVGDLVKITRKKNIFDKESKPTWTEANYEVKYRKATHPVTYKLIDPANNQILRGSYYEHEMQRARVKFTE